MIEHDVAAAIDRDGAFLILLLPGVPLANSPVPEDDIVRARKRDFTVPRAHSIARRGCDDDRKTLHDTDTSNCAILACNAHDFQ